MHYCVLVLVKCIIYYTNDAFLCKVSYCGWVHHSYTTIVWPIRGILALWICKLFFFYNGLYRPTLLYLLFLLHCVLLANANYWLPELLQLRECKIVGDLLVRLKNSLLHFTARSQFKCKVLLLNKCANDPRYGVLFGYLASHYCTTEHAHWCLHY